MRRSPQRREEGENEGDLLINHRLFDYRRMCYNRQVVNEDIERVEGYEKGGFPVYQRCFRGLHFF